MYPLPHPFSATTLLATLALVLASGSVAAASKENAADRWIPSIAFTSGMTFQDWSGDVSSEVCRGCTIPDPMGMEEALQPFADGEDRDQTPFAGIDFQLMSPETPVPGTPRVFVAVEILPTFGTDRRIATNGDIGPIGTRAANPDAQSFSEDTAQGQGSDTILKREGISYGAKVGLSFPLEILDRPVQIKPSFGWIRFGVELDGAVADADCLPQGSTTECNPNDLGMGFGNGFLRATNLSAKSTESFDGIGGGLDVETFGPRIGAIGTAVFAGFNFYRILGDRDVETRAGPATVSDVLGTDQVAARFGYEVDEWMYRFAVGLRLQWVGDRR